MDSLVFKRLASDAGNFFNRAKQVRYIFHRNILYNITNISSI